MTISMNKKLIAKYSTDNLKVYTVNPTYICKEEDINYVGGSHSYADSYVPPYKTHGEIWIRNDISPLGLEFKYYLLHEMYEYRLMATTGMNYRSAHKLANLLERKARLGSIKLVDELLKKEIGIQKRLIKKVLHKRKCYTPKPKRLITVK